MKSIRIIAAAMIILAAISCKKDETLRYNNVTTGNVVDGMFVSGQGNIFNVVENPCKGDILAAERSLVVCDVLNRTKGGESNEYDIRLNRITDVLTKNIVAVGTEPSAELASDDPVNIEEIWLGGGYVNMYLLFPIKAGSDTIHYINLVQQETTEDGVYIFHLQHNAQGETVEDMPDDVLGFGGRYVSFPLSKIITQETAKFELNWKCHKSTPLGYSKETEEKTIKGTYTKGY